MQYFIKWSSRSKQKNLMKTYINDNYTLFGTRKVKFDQPRKLE